MHTRASDRHRGWRLLPFVVVLVAVLVAVAPAQSALAAAGTADDVASYHSTDSHFSAASTLTNISVNGTGSAADATLDPEATSETLSRSTDSGSDTGTTAKSGLKITTDERLTYVEFDLSKNTQGATQAYIYDTASNQIASTSVSSRTATFTDIELANGSAYYLYVDDGGNSYTRGRKLQSYPVTGKTFSITASVDGGSEGTTYAYAINNITVKSAADDGTYTSDLHSAESIETAWVNLTLDNASATVTWQEDANNDNTWTDVATNTYTTDGNKTVGVSTTTTDRWRVVVDFDRSDDVYSARLHDEGVLFASSAPTVDNSSASPDATTVSDTDVTLSIDISDTDFGLAQGDSVTVEYYHKSPSNNTFTQIGTDTRGSNGTASYSDVFYNKGEHEWYVVATDSYGNSLQSATFSFNVTAQLNIRKESAPDSFVTSQVDLTVYTESNGTFTNTTSSGHVSMADWPGDKLVVVAKATGYTTRTTVITNTSKDHDIYLLDTSNVKLVNTTFTLTDRTGEYGDGTILKVKRSLNVSGTSMYRTIASDEFGVDGKSVTLKKDIRYRIVVENTEGDRRVLGAYESDQSETVNLIVGDVVVDPSEPTGPGYEANWTGKPDIDVTFDYNDSSDNTSKLWLEIYEYGNESNTLLTNTSFSGPYGTFTYSADVPHAYNNTTWVVHFTASTDSGLISGKLVVGPQRAVLGEMPDWLMTVIYVATIWSLAGLFSQYNGAIGGLVVAGAGGILWFVDFLPPMVDVGVTILAMLTAGILFLNERKDGGL